MTATGRRLRIDLAYDGTEFAGWQVQPGLRTVQGLLENALSRLQGDRPAAVRGAGRTDAGVHARAQVADTLFVGETDDEALAYALRRVLPEDVRPVRVRTVPDSFHARKSARAKTYVYRLDPTPHGDPFLARFCLHCPWPLDRDAMARAAGLLPGKRDWSGFTGSGGSVRDHVREMFEARVDRGSAGEIALVFRAEGFLYHMVRNLAGTLIQVGRSERPPEDLLRILDSKDRSIAGPTAAARGLTLERVDYDPAEEGVSE